MRRLALPALFLFSLGAVLLAPFVGMLSLSPADLWTSLSGTEGRIFLELRLPRVLLGWITGATLSLCGMVFQALFRNSLASPDMLGVSTGAAFGAVLSIRYGLAFSFLGIFSGLSLSAFLGAMAATAIIYGAGSLSRGRRGGSTLLLSGVAMSFLFGSLNMLIQYGAGYVDTFRMMRWSMGGISAVGFSAPLTALPALVLIYFASRLYAPELNLLVCGEEMAQSRGVPVGKLERILFFAVSLAVGLNVAICGPIGFVGLMSPHICRALVGADHRRLAPASLLFGGGFLVLCDTAARTLWAPAEIPVGVLTSCLGSIFFLWLLLTGKK